MENMDMEKNQTVFQKSGFEYLKTIEKYKKLI